MKKLTAEDQILQNVKKIHMIGIGGSGMCPLAEILYSKGYELSGSDNNESDPLKKVRKFAKVSLGHKAENVEGAQLVVYSAAIPQTNEELVYAREHGIPTIERSHLLGTITRMYDNVIGVCGTHGKTTVTSLITQILLQNNMNPNAVIGGKLPLVDHYGVTGDSELMVVESCEFVDTFLQLSEDIAVLLNIDNDHLDYFKTMDNLVNSFHKFVSQAKIVYANGDDQLVEKAVSDIDGKVVTFGFNKDNDYYPENVELGKFGYKFDVIHKGENLGNVELSIVGKHNIYNALAAISVCLELGLSLEGITNSIIQFRGAGRRFELIGDYGYVLADDYGHHPTEIEATLSAAKQLNFNKVVVVFQPFTFSRTAMLKEDFARVLSIADEVILTEIMGSREVNTYGVYSQDILDLMDGKGIIVDGFENIADYIESHYGQGDLVITMGCGDIYKVCRIISERKKESN